MRGTWVVFGSFVVARIRGLPRCGISPERGEGGVISQTEKPVLKTFFSRMDNVTQELPEKELFLLSLCFVGLSYATKAFFPPPTATLDVALQVQSVALESHHACLVFTRFAHGA